MANGQPNYAAPFFEERQRSIQQTDKEAAQAAALAESLGYYTPELQQKVTQPLGYNPTMGESLFGAPIRALGNIPGLGGLKNVGAPQPYNLGQAQQQQQFNMPQIPAGTDPETRKMLESIGMSMGLTPGKKSQVIPGMPSEVMGQPRLRTKYERDQEAFNQKQQWDLIMKHYQTDQEYRKVEADIQQSEAAAESSRAYGQYLDDKRLRGPDPTEMSMLKTAWDAKNEERTATGRPLIYYDDALKNYQKIKNAKAPLRKTAKVELYEFAQSQGYTGKIWDFERTLDQAKWDPLEVAHKVFYDKDSLLPYAEGMVNEDGSPNLEAQQAFIVDLAMQLTDQMDSLNERRKAAGDDYFYDDYEPIPKELLQLGVDEATLTEFMQVNNVPTRRAAIDMIKSYQRKQEKSR